MSGRHENKPKEIVAYRTHRAVDVIPHLPLVARSRHSHWCVFACPSIGERPSKATAPQKRHPVPTMAVESHDNISPAFHLSALRNPHGPSSALHWLGVGGLWLSRPLMPSCFYVVLVAGDSVVHKGPMLEFYADLLIGPLASRNYTRCYYTALLTPAFPSNDESPQIKNSWPRDVLVPTSVVFSRFYSLHHLTK